MTTQKPTTLCPNTMNHPITPSPELVRQWQREANHNEPMFPQVANQAAQWGADQELEACCEWLELNYNYTRSNHPLRTARRPNSPSLKEQALNGLQRIEANIPQSVKNFEASCEVIRRALEALPNDN